MIRWIVADKRNWRVHGTVWHAHWFGARESAVSVFETEIHHLALQPLADPRAELDDASLCDEFGFDLIGRSSGKVTMRFGPLRRPRTTAKRRKRK